MKKIDLTGMTFNHLKVVEESGRNKNGQVIWLCECDCGNLSKVNGYNLRNDKIKSCGCRKTESNTKHGQRKTRLYKIWSDMKRRCDNPKAPQYEYYGGRGIEYCQDWGKFIPFYQWAIESGYNDSLTIDRIDSDGNYEPDNCRWATKEEQSRNQRVRKDNMSGAKGVYKIHETGKYTAHFSLGVFDTFEEAKEAREQAEKIFWKSS